MLPEAGARLHRIRAFGEDLLRTPADPAEHLRDPFFWGGYVMAPWCNRIATTPTSVGRQTIRLPPNFGDGTAIHGQVFARAWVADTDGASFNVRAGGDGWPWAYDVSQRISVEGTVLSLDCALTNGSDEPMPAGIGLHPWWRAPLQLSVDAGLVYPDNTAPPTIRPTAATGHLDLRQLGEPAEGLDATWTQIGSPRVELAWPALRMAATLSLSPAADHVVVAAPPELGAVAVEVQTHAADGLGRLLRGEPGGMRMLAPGDELSLSLQLAVRRT